MRVAVIHDHVPTDAAADERDALVQAGAVSAALRELGHTPVQGEFALDLERTRRTIEGLRPDTVFNLVESVEGRGRLVHLAPALLETMGVPFTGAGSAATFTTANKLVAKRIMAGAGIPTPEWVCEGSGGAAERRSDDGAGRFVPGKFILKSVWEHASRGIGEDSVIDAAAIDDVHAALADQRETLAGEGFAERYIEGREFNLALLERDDGSRGAEVLPPAEMVFEGFPPGRARIVSYAAKWDEASFEYRNTHRRYTFPASDTALIDRLRDTALRCWWLFGLRGYARVDFRVDEDGFAWVLEVNTNPCLSPDAGFAAAVEQAGMRYAEAVRRIVAAAVAGAGGARARVGAAGHADRAVAR